MSLIWSQSCFNLRTWLSHPPLCKPQGFLSTELVISSMPSPQPHISMCVLDLPSQRLIQIDEFHQMDAVMAGFPRPKDLVELFHMTFPLSQQIVCWENGNEHHHSSWTGHFLPEPATGGMLAEEFLRDLHEIPQPSCLIIRSGSLAFRC